MVVIINSLMHKRALILVLSIYLLLPIVSAGSPWMINEMDARFTFTGEIDVTRETSGSQLNWVEASFYLIPYDSALQTTDIVSITPSTYQILTDDVGNGYIKFRWENPANNKLPYEIILDTNVARLHYAIVSDGSLDDPIPEAIKPYTEVDNLTYWTGYMKAKAESITEGSESTLEAVRRLTDWVATTLDYDKSCWQDSLPAEWVWNERRGVCDEFTNLFISLARSVGIPARYVEGLVYSGEEWNFHAWAEVYIGNWIPVDPTYNEVGFIDSSHVALAKVHSDTEVYNRLSWEGYDISANFGSDNFEVDLKNTKKQTLLSSKTKLPTESGAPEALSVKTTVTNLANSYVVATCSVNMPVDMAVLEEEEKSVLLEPHGESDISWNIASPPNLDTNFLHRMPVQIICFPGDNESKEIVVDPRIQVVPIAKAAITDLTVINQTHTIIKIKNTGTKKINELIATICFEDARRFCDNQNYNNLALGQEIELLFSNLNIGEGDNVTANLSSSEFETSTLETTLSDIKDPARPSTQKEENMIDNLNDSFAVLGNDDSESFAIFLLIIALIIVMIAIAIAVSIHH